MLCVAYNSAVPLARVTKYAYEATAPEFRRVANIERWLSLHKHRKMYMKLVERGVSVDLLRQLYEYVEGQVIRKSALPNTNNKYEVGTRVGSEYTYADTGRTVRVMHIQGATYLEHRVIYALVHGVWPEYDIDHIDGNTLNNRIKNLRDATRQQNTQNVRLRTNNSSGVCGVQWNSRLKKWVAVICHNYVVKHLGCFTTIEEATEVRKEAEKLYGFHTNHGKARKAISPQYRSN